MDDKYINARLETDIAELYLKNQQLLLRINQVIAASDSEDMDGLRSALLDLLSETATRFENEERLMTECRYEAAEAHLNEHQQLLSEIRHQIADLNADKLTVAYIGRFMHNWILQHIVSKDSLFVNAVLTQSGMTDRRRANSPLADDDAIAEFEERRLENLEPIRWSATMEIGVPSVDKDHRAIVTLLNAVVDANKTNDKPRLFELLEQLGNETAEHFQAEEQFMASTNYALLKEHKAEHQRLLDEYANQVDEFRKNKISAEFLCRFIYRWFVRHIEILDATLRQS